MRHPIRVTATLALTAGLVVGCTSAEDAPDDANTTAEEVVTDLEPDNPELTPGEEESPEPVPGEDGAANALSVAAEELGGQAIEIDRSDDGGEELWQVTVAVEDEAVEVYVSLDGNAVVREGESEPLDDEDRRRLDELAISASEAATTAVSELAASVEEVDLTDENGVVVWDIELRTTDGASTDVLVDAVTGEVL